MAVAKKAKVTKEFLEIDLTGVEASERRRKKVIPEGIYHAKVVEVGPNKFNSGRKGVTWVFEVTDAGKGKGARFWENNTLVDTDGSVMENQLWTIRGVLQALEPRVKIPDKLMKIPFSKLVGRTVGIEVADGEDQEGRPRSEIIDIFHPSMIEDNDTEEDEDEEESDDEDEEADEEEEDEESDEDSSPDEFDLDEDEL